MGQVPDDLNEISAVAAEVDSLRERTQSIVAELERRLRARAGHARELVDRTRHTFERVKHAVDVRAQVREHPAVTIGVGSAVTIALGLGVYFVVARRLEARRPINRLRGRVAAYRALLAEPQRALRPRDPLGPRLLKAVLVAGAVTITRALATIFVKRVVQQRLLPPPRVEAELIE